MFGWCVVGLSRQIQIPAAAHDEYGFERGESVIITRGSRSSGGFGIGRQKKLANSPLQSRFLGWATLDAGRRVMLPPVISVEPGERLLVVRGSGLALGFLRRGPIYDEALRRPEVETFEIAGKDCISPPGE